MVRNVSDLCERTIVKASIASMADGATMNTRKLIMIVEDEAMIAMELEHPTGGWLPGGRSVHDPRCGH